MTTNLLDNISLGESNFFLLMKKLFETLSNKLSKMTSVKCNQ